MGLKPGLFVCLLLLLLFISRLNTGDHQLVAWLREFCHTLEIIPRTLREVLIARILRKVVNRERLCGTSAFYFLYACMLGFRLHSGDHRAHSTGSGKQREIVRY